MATGSLRPWPFGPSCLRQDRASLPGGHQAQGMPGRGERRCDYGYGQTQVVKGTSTKRCQTEIRT